MLLKYFSKQSSAVSEQNIMKHFKFRKLNDLPRPKHQGKFSGPSESTAKPTIVAFKLKNISELGTYKHTGRSLKL